MNYTWLDYIILLVVFLNTTLGLARGLVREVISIMTLIVALVVAMRFTVPVSEFLSTSNGFKDVVLVFSSFTPINAIGPLSLISFGISFLVLFVGTWCLGEAVNYYAANAGMFVLFPFLAIFDRILAAVLGFFRGYVFSLIVILVLGLTPIVKEAGWTHSSLLPQLLPKANQLGEMVRPGGFPVWS